jgi:DnaJ-class molecular chaperone
MTDYYAVLGLSRSAEGDAIAKAYRRQALTYNPQCNLEHSDPKELARLFKLVSQSYVVLSDPKLRAIYDAYGEDGVRHGGTGDVGVKGGLAVQDVDPNAVFRQFFGVDSPFQVLGDINGVRSNQHQFFSEDAAINKHPPKTEPVEVSLEVTLEDIFSGSTRKITWEYSSENAKGDITRHAAEFEFTVPRGIRAGSVITLKGKGNVRDGRTQGDVLVKILEAPHKSFTRFGDDLGVVVPITLTDALAGTHCKVETIERRILPVQIDEIVHPNFRRVISGEGLPRTSNPNERGDLIITCATTFPSYLTAEQKSELKRILSQ